MLLDTFLPKNLLAGSFPVVTKEVTILAGQDLKAGAVLGKITASDKHQLVDIAASDGSEDIDVILLDDIDATAADVVSIGGLSGEYLESALTLGGATTVDDVRAAARQKSIYFK